MEQNRSKEHSKYYGPLMMLFACICFSGGGLAMKLVPWNPLAINGARNVLAVMVLGIYMILTHHPLKFNKIVFVGSLAMAGTTTLFTIANKLTTAGNTIILQYTVPIWIVIMMLLFFGTKPNRLDVVTIVIVLVGIICFFLDSLSAGHVLGDMVAVTSGIFYAGLFILNEFEEGDALSSMIIGQFICGVFLGPLTFREHDFSAPVILSMLFLGIIQVGVAYILFSEGTKYTNPVTASLIAAVEPILNPLLVAIFWGEVLKPLSLVGAAIVIVAVVVYNIKKMA